MNKKILGWEFAETKNFVEFVLQNIDRPFLWIFENWAEKNSRQPLSVRNYFYKLCKTLKQSSFLKKQLEISDDDFLKLFSKRFDDFEEVWLLKQILPTKNQKSVRKACLNLAGGDAFKMARYQNKFRHLLKTKKNLVENVMIQLNESGIETRNPFKKSNVIKISSKSEITESDLKGLFMGIVKIIKNDLNEKFELKIKNEKQVLNSKLENVLKTLNQKEMKLSMLEEENDKLKQKVEVASKKLEDEKKQNIDHLKKVKNFVQSKNLQKLKNFLMLLEDGENKLKL